jgi:salicylate hydroxylase
LIRRGDVVNVVAVRETDAWVDESWSNEAPTAELVAAFPDVHENLRDLLERAQRCFKWGLFDRDPLPTWSKQRATLLGDAAHPMLPFLGQGAAMAMEDGFVLARELARSPDDLTAALRSYEAERVLRTAQVQLAAREQAKLLHLSSTDLATKHLSRNALLGAKVDWLYQYDPTGGNVRGSASPPTRQEGAMPT